MCIYMSVASGFLEFIVSSSIKKVKQLKMRGDIKFFLQVWSVKNEQKKLNEH